MKFKQILSNILIAFLGVSLVFAQNGKITGTIIDDETGEAMLGATIMIVGTSNGASADLDGKYTLSSIAPGIYELKASFIGYAAQTIKEVEVKAGQTTIINVRLAVPKGGNELETVTVTADALKNSEAALLTVQKNSTVVLDGISAEQFSKIGDNDAASAVRRVTGVNIEGGKYIYVRGLGDRYTKTTVNGGEVSGLDPNRNTVQMDLFPTSLLDNVVVYKTFAPNLYGDFTGGYVDIATKEFPETMTFQVSLSLGYNTQSSFNNEFLTHESTGAEWLTFPGTGRDIPSIVSGGIVNRSAAESNNALANQLRDQTLSFGSFQTQTTSPFLNSNFSLAFGNQYQVAGGNAFGVIIGLNHQRSFEHYSADNDGEANVWKLQGLNETALNRELGTNDTRSVENALLGALVNLSYKLPNHKFSLNLMRNQSTQKEGRNQIGRKASDDPSEVFYTNRLDFQERALSTLQLKAKHVMPSFNKLEIDWLASYSRAIFDQPDLRFLTWVVRDNGAGTARTQPSTGLLPIHFYRDMGENSYNGKLDFTLPVATSKIKFGAAYLAKDREYRENQYQLDDGSGGNLLFANNDPSDADNILTNIFSADNTSATAVAITDTYEAENNYDANQTVFGAYAMVELPLTSKLKVITGARYEKTQINFASFGDYILGGNTISAFEENTLLDNNDILPSVNFIYNLVKNEDGKKDMNLRVSYNRTLARPTFRELAPVVTFDFVGGFLQRGNPNLRRSLIDNVDLRWEYYTRPGEIFSVSGFYKRFQDPIEPVINAAVASTTIIQTWENLADANFYGIELEARKKLDFITPSLANFTLGANFTYIFTEVELTEEQKTFVESVNSINNDNTRPLNGQAPWVVNTSINYQNDAIGLKSGLVFYMNGPRLSTVDLANNHIFERPRPNLRFNISKDFGQFNVRFSANNLLNPEYLFDTEYNGTDYIFQNSRRGRTFSIRIKYLLQK